MKYFKSILKNIVLIGLFCPLLAYAGGGDSPMSEGFSWIITQMYGATGISLATLAVMGVGLLCVAHRLEWKILIFTIVGISIIFGAGAVVSGIQSLVHN